MPTTWSVFAKSSVLWASYTTDRESLFDTYIQYEKDGNVEKTEEWFSRHAELFAKYQLTQEQIDTIVMDDAYFAPRAGVAELLNEIQSQDVPLYIVSSGVSQIIARWFELRYDYTPDIIIANELIMEDWRVVWVDSESIICPLDKSIELEFEHDAQDIILIGDSIEDTQIIENPTKTLGFTDEERGFTINLGRDASMKEIIKYL